DFVASRGLRTHEVQLVRDGSPIVDSATPPKSARQKPTSAGSSGRRVPNSTPAYLACVTVGLVKPHREMIILRFAPTSWIFIIKASSSEVPTLRFQSLDSIVFSSLGPQNTYVQRRRTPRSLLIP